MKNNKKIIVVAGATATGKTAKAIELATQYETSILSFDSRQCYNELNIGVAKPTKEELQLVPHYFINSHSINSNMNVALFEKYALTVVNKLFETNNVIIAVGGTGLYLNALRNGVDAIPSIPTILTERLLHQYNELGINWLKNEIQQLDKSYTNLNDLNNAHRMLRALAVVMHTGNSIRQYQLHTPVTRQFDVELNVLHVERTELYQRINNRVDNMIAMGLIAEVEKLQPHQHLNALQTVGYTELFDYYNGKINLPTAIALIKQHTRNYAKRQITWFKKLA